MGDTVVRAAQCGWRVVSSLATKGADGGLRGSREFNRGGDVPATVLRGAHDPRTPARSPLSGDSSGSVLGLLATCPSPF